MAEFHAGIAKDPGDYIIGEKIVKVAPRFLRRMDNPAKDAPLYGGQFHSYNCWNPTMGADDVHFSSGPANHFFYLLAEGSGAKVIGGRQHNSPTCNATTVNGIGKLAAGKIWYRALNVYMTSTTNYMLARDATIRAARDLYGPTSIQCARVVRAWNAVAAPAGRWACAAQPPAIVGNVVGNSNFEGGPNDVWTEDPAAPTIDIITDLAGFTPDGRFGFFARTGSWYAFLNGYGQTATDTLSQEIQVPNSASPRLRFWVMIESAEVAGAVDTLQVRVNGTLLPGATYSSNDANNSYTKKTLNLSSYAGETVTLSFIGQEDSSVPTVFLLDDVTVTEN
jgi:Thermolysin metallopeptidase, alpha-helical domain